MGVTSYHMQPHIHLQCFVKTWQSSPRNVVSSLYVAIANLAKSHAIAQQVNGLVIAIA